MRKIMILGAGIYQVPLIKKAKSLGYRTFVCSTKGNYPGFDIADKVFYVNTRDKETCLKIAQKEQVDAVCTTGTDVALPSLGYICDSMHLSGPSEKSAIASSNKYIMKNAFVENGVRCAKCIKIDTMDSCIEAAESLGYPCVLKVVDSSGSRGVVVIKNQEHLLNAYNIVFQYTKQKYVIVEEFLNGIDFGAQAMVYNGEVLFVVPHTTDTFKGDAGVPIGHTVPYSNCIDQGFSDDVTQQMKKAIKALDINNAVVNADMMLVDGKPYILEVGARCGATGLAEIDSITLGVDIYEAIISISLGNLDVKTYTNPSIKCAATASLICSDKTGKLKSWTNIEHPKLHEFKIDYKVGDKVDKFKIGPHRLGHIIVGSQTKDESETLAADLIKQINLVVE